ncbi:trans-sialidase, partial [Trypanosoma cruzi]
AGPYELWWRQFSPDGTIHPPARSSDADRTGICQLPPPREGKDDTESGGTTAPQVTAEPSRQNEDWQQPAAADGPNTVDPSPTSNTATNTSATKPELAFVRKKKVTPTPPERRSTPVTEPKEDPIDDAMSGLINVEVPRGVDLFVPRTTLL